MQSAHYFYPRSPCGERRLKRAIEISSFKFLSTLSLRRATAHNFPTLHNILISIHALLAESDRGANRATQHLYISIHALLAESDSLPATTPHWQKVFLSTLSLRRATFALSMAVNLLLFLSTLSLRRATLLSPVPLAWQPNFYPRSPCGERLDKRCKLNWDNRISIHALLAESDLKKFLLMCTIKHFYPRSPCGERLGLDGRFKL